MFGREPLMRSALLNSFLIVVLFIFPMAITPSAYAKIGGSGGTISKTIKCPTHNYATGIKVLRSDTVEQVKLRCHRIDSRKRWNGSPKWTDFTGTLNPRPTSNASDLFCPSNKWITAIAGTSKNGVIKGLRITCSEFKNEHEKHISINKENKQVGGRGSWKAETCDSNRLGSYVLRSLTARYGLKLDSLVKKCESISSIPATPDPQYPSYSHSQYMVTYASPAKAKFSAKNLSKKYDGQYCISQVNQSNCLYMLKQPNPSSANTPVELSLPNNSQGKMLSWKMRNCVKNSNPLHCSPWSRTARFGVLPAETSISNLRSGQQLLSRSVNFQWADIMQADSYRIVIFDNTKVGITPSFNKTPEMRDIPGTLQVIKIDAKRSSIRINIDARLSNRVIAKIATCKVIIDIGRQCNDSKQSISITLPPATRKSR